MLLRKPNVPMQHWSATKEMLKNKILLLFGEYLPRIEVLVSDDQCYLIGFRHDHRKKFYRSKDGDWLCYEGQVFSLHEEKKLEAEEILKLYLQKGNDFTDEIDGHFVIKLFDSGQGCYKVINDFIKNKANFICSTSEYLLITPYALSTAIIKEPQLDKYALNEFMWRYYVMSYRTLLDQVSKLRPASIYKVIDGEYEQKTYWYWPKKYTNRKFDDCVSDMSERVKETARLIHNAYDSTCIDFTMGQDSRQNIVGFTNQELPFSTMTFGKNSFEEVKNIHKLSEKYNIEHHVIGLKEDYTHNLVWHFKRAVILGSCEEPGHLLGRILYMRERQKNYGEVSLNGMDGHFYKNGLWDELYTFNLYRAPKKFSIQTFLNLRALSKNYRDDYFSAEIKSIKRESKAYFGQIAQKAIEGYQNSPVSIQVDKFDLYHWLTFAITSNSTCNSICNAVSPLLLRRNMDLALTIPVKWKFNLSRWQRAFVYKLDPALAAEQTDFGGVTMVPKTLLTYPWFFFKYFFYQSKRLRKKLMSKIGIKVETHLQEAWDYLPLYQQLATSADFDQLKNADCLITVGVIDKAKWGTYIRSFDEKDIDSYENLFKILSIELYLQLAGNLRQDLTPK